MKYATQCRCIDQTSEGGKASPLPEDLNQYRIRLIKGHALPYPLEPKLAAMIVMKIFLGMRIPEMLRMTSADSAKEGKGKEKASIEEQ